MSFFLLILIYTGIYALMAIGQNLITGYGGMLSLCQAGFYGIGAYATAILTVTFGWNFWATLPVAIGLSALFGLLIGLPTLRLNGDYLAIATLGFGEIVRNVLNNWVSLTNGPMGIQRIPMVEIFGFQINPYRKVAFAILVWVFVVALYFIFKRFAKCRLGRALMAISEDEIAAGSMGINVTIYKVVAFMLGASSAGLAGSFFAVYSLSDPRCNILKECAQKLAAEKGLSEEFALHSRVAEIAGELIAEKRRIYKGVSPNVDFYSGLIYSMLGLDRKLFTPLFAIARIAGWSAHRIEELSGGGKIIRPAYQAISEHQPYLPLEERD